MEPAGLLRDRDVRHERRRDERSVERVGPGVVRAPDGAAHCAFTTKQTATAMATKIQMRAKTVLGSDEDNALARDVEHTISAEMVELLGAADVEPLPPEDRFSLAGKERLVPVGFLGKRGLKSDIFRRFHR